MPYECAVKLLKLANRYKRYGVLLLDEDLYESNQNGRAKVAKSVIPEKAKAA